MKTKLPTLIVFFIAACVNAQSPTFQWAKQMGGTGSYCVGNAIKVDALGNVYTTGMLVGTVDFDPGPGTFNLTSSGVYDIFISKLDIHGNFVWAKNMGGSLYDEGYSIAVDAMGNVYTTGYFESTVDFDPGVGTFNLTSMDERDIFISKLDASGNFVWAKNIGGPGNDYGYSIALDEFSNVYTAGNFYGTVDFDPGVGMFNLMNGLGQFFILKLDAKGDFVWAKQMPGNYCGQFGSFIAIDSKRNVYTTECFSGTGDFDPGAGTFNLTSTNSSNSPNGLTDVFISKIDENGNFVWAKNFGGMDQYTRVRSIALDGFGNLYATGMFNGTVDFDPGTGIFNLMGLNSSGYNVFISKIDTMGNFIWAKQISGIDQMDVASISADAMGNVYTTGFFGGTVDYDLGMGTFNLTALGNADIFISKLNANGNFAWAKQIGDSKGVIHSMSITTDSYRNVYTTGWFANSTFDFDPGAGVFNLSVFSMGNQDAFVHKMSQGEANSIKTGKARDSELSVYPNPTDCSFTIEITHPTANTVIEIYNCLGALVVKDTKVHEQNKIELSNQVNGLYFIKIIKDGTVIASQKIIKK